MITRVFWALVLTIFFQLSATADTKTFYWQSSGGDLCYVSEPVQGPGSGPNTYRDQRVSFGYASGYDEAPCRTDLRFGGLEYNFSSVTKAVLYLETYQVWNSNTINPVVIAAVTSPWIYGEYRDLWVSQSPPQFSGACTFNNVVGEPNGGYNLAFDITPIVQTWVNGTMPDYGMMIMQWNEGTSQNVFWCENSGTGAPGPKLVVTGTLRNTSQKPTVTPEQFGAKGDDTTNDNDAFVQASFYLQGAGGGTLNLGANKEYLVGKQIHCAGCYPYWLTSPVIRIKNCASAVLIQGLGCSWLQRAAGMYYGSFDPNTGTVYNPKPNQMPFWNLNYCCSAGNLISFDTCDANISAVNIDGNGNKVSLGGHYGDSGYQCTGCGVYVNNCTSFGMENSQSNYNPLDGLDICRPGVTSSSPVWPHYLYACWLYGNARQGLSWVGGRGLTAWYSYFNNTGEDTSYNSSPGCGLDIEPEASQCNNGDFEYCYFQNDITDGVTFADSSGTLIHNVLFDHCTIIGLFENPNPQPGVTFTNCTY